MDQMHTCTKTAGEVLRDLEIKCPACQPRAEEAIAFAVGLECFRVKSLLVVMLGRLFHRCTKRIGRFSFVSCPDEALDHRAQLGCFHGTSGGVQRFVLELQFRFL